MCLLLLGWILNLGNRLNVVSRFSADDQPYFRGFVPWGYTFRRGCVSFAVGVFTLPGCMTVYAVEGDARVLRRPVAAFLRAWSHRRTYVRAWGIGLLSIVLSFGGLLAAGVGFLFTSIWAWDIVGYAFTVAMYNDE